MRSYVVYDEIQIPKEETWMRPIAKRLMQAIGGGVDAYNLAIEYLRTLRAYHPHIAPREAEDICRAYLAKYASEFQRNLDRSAAML